MLEKKLAEMKLVLPEIPVSSASFVGYKRSGNLIYISGQLPLKDGKPTLIGRLGDDVSIDDAYVAAQQCTLNVLAQLKLALDGNWDRVVQIVRVGGFVRCTGDFGDAAKVVNGASDLLVRLFGAAGSHARAAIGVASLPLNVAVEIEATIEIS
ncbi:MULTISPECIES: RidA family protein [unclassified Herbaspirillum]|uniref:RidA family protein n=1 Tax=unclassified Herbaspirillum TaxID=2624150 RepID=UPI000E2E499A|nr:MULTISPECIES: RidA family protein [unclassified Herbaspirillum]RFB65665.1 RidA family protein [Herbaspirillum sp. 3R-3a1]TFI09033.1 RidA family protein [Herbaspirillum sp. 3R11]TFI15451.1 RidA family protein [Herbaspirillum sp. 3R-11]TFI31779.1 RidA family protein [Herbaspirillum sp. 3C11]